MVGTTSGDAAPLVTPADRPLDLSFLVTAIVLAGTGVFAFHVTRLDAFGPARSRTFELGLLVFLLVLCEIRPVRLLRGGRADEIVASSTFAFALLLAFGPAAALTAQAVASVLADVANGKSVRQIVRNVGISWVAWGVASFAFEASAARWWLERTSTFPGWAVGAIAITGAVYFLVNKVLVGVELNEHGRLAFAADRLATVRHEFVSDWALLALAPIVFVVAERSPVLLPLLLLPAYGVFHSASISLEKEHQSSHDALTDLPNRLLFNIALDEVLERARAANRRAAVLLIDLDRFKEVNDTLGHDSGDLLLQQVGPRIAAALPSGALISRLGGDEFAVILEDVDDSRDALRRAASVVESLERPFQVAEFRLDVEASIGIAVFPEHGLDKETLLQRADIAMYVAKGEHWSASLYDAGKDHHSRRRLGLLGELRASLAARQIVLHYQPKVNLATGEVDSVEALVRWNHPQHGLLAPDEFVPLAERTGLIRPLTTYILAEATAQARIWRDAGIDLPVAVNLSARSLHDPQLPDEIRALLRQCHLQARYLEVEITESSIMTEPARARRTLRDLAAMGIRLSIDDYGTGYSSLSYLQQLPVSEIKIDRSFVTGMVDNDADAVIVRSTIELARNLGLAVVAEGVETEAGLKLLTDARCTAIQGYFVTRPLPAAEFEAWLAGRKSSTEPKFGRSRVGQVGADPSEAAVRRRSNSNVFPLGPGRPAHTA
jgi:diguanylate cyclase (GGDEF)-like protein